MDSKSLKDNDALRLEFIRSVVTNISGDRDNSFARNVLFTFIRGSARSPLTPGDEAALRAYLQDVIDTCVASHANIETIIHDVTALAKHIADNETAPVAAFVTVWRDHPEKILANGMS